MYYRMLFFFKKRGNTPAVKNIFTVTKYGFGTGQALVNFFNIYVDKFLRTNDSWGY